MCGLVGIFDTRGKKRPIDDQLLTRMNQTQIHRGPDEGGIHSEPGLGLGHRRLSIIDLSSGQQPLFNEDGSVVVVYNGEIYNFQELSAELQAAGHVFKTHCDTEVIVHAWEEWGESCVQRFRGMFAFAIWDRNRETLFLARDRLGIKPLYYAWLADGHIVFSSELKALLVHPDVSRQLDPRAVQDYFTYGYVPDPKTILTGVNKLSPGFTLAVRRGDFSAKPKQYWDVCFEPQNGACEEDIEAELIHRLEEAVKIRMIAEVPLGAFLSGGVDSSAVVAMMAGLAEEPVNACSISFGDPQFNEATYASVVADRYEASHKIEQVDPEDFDLVDQLATVYDEPFADSSAIPTYRVCELARKQVTVALSGDGGDENFAGYSRYRWFMSEDRVRNLLPSAIGLPLFRFLGGVYPRIQWAPKVFRAKATLQNLGRDPLEAYLQSICVMSSGIQSQLFSKAFQMQLQGYRSVEVLHDYADAAAIDHPLSRLQYLDMKTYLPGDILTKVDRASMRHSLEVRVPILDHKFVEWAAGLPPDLKLRNGEGKYIFKKAMKNHLPADILYRPKMGFAVPLAAWFRGPLRQRLREALLGSVLAETGMFRRESLQRLFDEHQSGAYNHSAALWSLLMFESFHRRVLQ